MKHVPKYLLPRIAAVPDTESEDKGTKAGFVPFKKNAGRGGPRGRGRGRGRGGAGRGGKKSDPLKKFGR
jgi:ATP-dependent RNA helicase DDX56/DBP9